MVMRAGDRGRAQLNRQPYSCAWALLTVRAVSTSPLVSVNKKAQSYTLPRRRSRWAFRRRLEHAYPRTSGRARDIVYNKRESNPMLNSVLAYTLRSILSNFIWHCLVFWERYYFTGAACCGVFVTLWLGTANTIPAVFSLDIVNNCVGWDKQSYKRYNPGHKVV